MYIYPPHRHAQIPSSQTCTDTLLTDMYRYPPHRHVQIPSSQTCSGTLLTDMYRYPPHRHVQIPSSQNVQIPSSQTYADTLLTDIYRYLPQRYIQIPSSQSPESSVPAGNLGSQRGFKRSKRMRSTHRQGTYCRYTYLSGVIAKSVLSPTML